MLLCFIGNPHIALMSFWLSVPILKFQFVTLHYWNKITKITVCLSVSLSLSLYLPTYLCTYLPNLSDNRHRYTHVQLCMHIHSLSYIQIIFIKHVFERSDLECSEHAKSLIQKTSLSSFTFLCIVSQSQCFSTGDHLPNIGNSILQKIRECWILPSLRAEAAHA